VTTKEQVHTRNISCIAQRPNGGDSRNAQQSPDQRMSCFITETSLPLHRETPSHHATTKPTASSLMPSGKLSKSISVEVHKQNGALDFLPDTQVGKSWC